MNKLYLTLFALLIVFCGSNDKLLDPNVTKLNGTWFRYSNSMGVPNYDSTEAFEVLRFEGNSLYQYLKYDNYVEYYKWYFEIWNDTILKTIDHTKAWLCGAFYYREDTLIIERKDFKAMFVQIQTKGPPSWWPDSIITINMDSLNLVY